MAETNAKIHVLADETLGGIKREYVEVDRKAEVGEKIIVSSIETHNMRDMTIGNVYDVISGSGAGSTSVLVRDDVCDKACAAHNGYRVLEPTNILIVNSQRFEMVNDNAEKGDMVIVTDSYDFPVGHVDTVKEVDDDRPDGSVYLVEGANDETYLDRSEEEYRVLVPVEDEPKPADPIDVIASLAQEVAELKKAAVHSKGQTRALADIQETEAKDLRKKIAKLQDEIDTLHKDNRTLGEELARLKYPAKNESIIESAPFVLVIHGGRGEFDVYQRGKKIENISRLEIEADSRIGSSIDLEFNNVGERP